MNTYFSERLKELRLDRNIGQVELANRIGVSKGTISLWENGLREPTLSNIVSLAKFFDVTADDLIGLTDY